MSPVLYLLVMLGIILSFPLQSHTQNFNMFMEKHIVPEKGNINCNVTIKERNIRNRNECRPRNTFIHDTNGKIVRDLCSGIVSSTVVSSKEPLALTDCRMLKGSLRPPNCAYNQTEEMGTIYITCENNYPVHFVRFEASFSASYCQCFFNLLAVFLISQLLLFLY
ncbi:hypothetical protein GDO86_001664 [Hymenochirus boettgeri]|uniref:Ribonuclease A-domain domain-containing protein n=1 Tax=Hymenochirus boettgeri TaxID=247094 RepID=A0A8T2KFL3_9PIPI|nr:hypothetical protein GDO86_001664 [Hymenochirus boettgeri]